MSIDLPGFADPVIGAQAAFRAILDAMSRPGSIRNAGIGLTPPAPLTPATASVLLTLVDADTPLWLAPDFSPARDWIAFHCGAPFAAEISSARFVLTTSLPALDTLDTGSDEAPEDSATVILQIPSLGAGRRVCIAGPGLREPGTIGVGGLPENFAALWAENHGFYPRGIDLIVCGAEKIMALPRSVGVTEV